MNAFLIINAKDQDQVLGNAFDAAMVERKWKINENFPFVYTKKFKVGLSEKDIKGTIKKELNEAVFDAEWEKLPYSYTLSETAPSNSTTK